jgi:hypothetical protein
VAFSGPRRPPPSLPTAAAEPTRLLVGGESCIRRNWLASLLRGLCLFWPHDGFRRGSGDAVEVDRRVNAAGTVGVAGQQVSVGLPLAGQRVTLRLEAATMHVLADGALVRSLPTPVPVGSRARLHGARLARGGLVVPQGPVVVRRRASQRGQLQVAGERVQVGLSHARQVLTVHVAEREFRIFDEGGLIKIIARRDHQEVTRIKAHKQHKPHGNKG